MEKVAVKDRILEAALTLFSEKGYDGVGVDQIAETVGLKGPSLYKHFKGKKAILDALITKIETHYEKNFGSKERAGEMPKTLEELKAASLGRINFSMHDPMIQKVRKLLSIEQFRNPELAKQANKHHLDMIRDLFEGMFRTLIAEGVLKDFDASVMALEYVAPVTLLIHRYDRCPDEETYVMQEIEAHIDHFIKVYKA